MNHDLYFWYGSGALATIPAIITGLMAGPPLEEFEESGDGKGRKGLVLAGTVVGCGCLLTVLVVVVIAVLCLLGPALGHVFSRISSGLY